jgi:ankyrin repeat protein
VMVQFDGWTPLIAASGKGHVEALRALLDAGATVNLADVSWDSEAVYLNVGEWVERRECCDVVTVHEISNGCGLRV